MTRITVNQFFDPGKGPQGPDTLGPPPSLSDLWVATSYGVRVEHPGFHLLRFGDICELCCRIIKDLRFTQNILLI